MSSEKFYSTQLRDSILTQYSLGDTTRPFIDSKSGTGPTKLKFWRIPVITRNMLCRENVSPAHRRFPAIDTICNLNE